MTRPLGYSVERQDDGRIALVHAERCWTCSGSGKVAHSWEVTCPDGCTFEAQSRPVSSSVKCKKCPGRWDSSEFKAVSVMGACWDCCGGLGMRCSMTLFEVETARTLRDALTAALIVPIDETLARVERETFTHADREWARQDAWERRPENIDRPKCNLLREWADLQEVPDAAVASEGAAKGAGSSTLADLYDDVPSNIADGDR
jgi:hypothetical protein